MNDTTHGALGAGLSRSELESRLSAIERRLARLEDSRTPSGDRLAALAAELGVLREAVADLAAGNLDLHNQMIKLVSSCERLLAGAGDEALVAARRGALRRSGSFVRRVARRTVQGAVGAARRLTGPRRSGPGAALEFDIELRSSPARQAPRIAVVVRTSEDPATVELPSALRRQTEPDLAVVVWNDEMSTAAVHTSGADVVVVGAADRSAVAAAAPAGFYAEFPSPVPRIHPTLLERCRWTVASEDLPLVVADIGGSEPGWRLEPAADWVGGPTGGRSVQPKVVKIVGGSRWGGFDRPGSQIVGAGHGRGYAARAGTAGKVVHRVAPLSGVAAPFPPGDERPAVLVVASRRGGELAAWLLRSLAEDFRLTVVLTGGADGEPLVRAMTELADRAYPVAGFLEPEVWPSLVADLVRAHRVGSVVRVGAPIDLPEFDEPRPLVVDLPLHPSEVAADADLVLALGGGIGAEAGKRGVRIVPLIPGPGSAGDDPAAGEPAGVRSAYGVPEGGKLVLTVCNLEPGWRPEDVTAVARRLRHLEDVYVLLVGRGSLAGSISDLAGYFELERFCLAPPGHTVTELAAVSDCVLSTAEHDPWPVAVGAALALGRSVVATEIDGVRELAAAADFDRCVLCPVGDVDALAAAVVDALGNHRKPRATKKAWNAARTRSSNAAQVIREALGGVSAGERENS